MQEEHGYTFRTEPLDHQREAFEKTANLDWFGCFDEQGTGKSKTAIDVAAHRFLRGDIDGVLILAPSGVQRNWISDEVPVHCPEDVLSQSHFHIFKSQTQLSKTQKMQIQDLLDHKGLAWLAISYDSLMTKWGKNTVWRFLKHRRVAYFLDEAHNIKTANAKRTKTVIASARYAVVRRAMTGTPVSNGPFDIYKLMEFLDPNFWKDRGIATYAAFKAEFGKWVQVTIGEGDTQRSWPELKGYQHIDRLRRMVRPHMSRIRKADVLDLPDKVFSQRYFEMSPDQREAFERLKEEYLVELSDGTTATATLPIVRLLRLQQISCGYLPTDDEEPVHQFKRNPRLELLEEFTGDWNVQGIIWSRFTRDVDQIMDLLGKSAVRYDGQVSEEDRERNKFAFKKGDAQWLVGKTRVGGSGLTLNEADVQVFYSNTFSYVDRSQGEDRSHRIGREAHRSLTIVDLLGERTVDWRIVQALRRKENIASQITGDQLKDWLQNEGR